VVRDLHRLVARAELRAPFVLVGASFGGLTAQLYADRFPRQVAGLVLVDALHPDLDRRIEALLTPRQIVERRRALSNNLEGLPFPELLRSDLEARAAWRRLAMPVAVIRHGLPFSAAVGFPSAAVERLWTGLQRSLAAHGTPSRIWVARDSHHRIAESEPAIVGHSVEWVLREARR
jgi:pimeloyl-ACP methyl ester carboxylesterase